MTVPARLPIEVRGQLTERDHLDALRVVQRRLGSRWWSYALFLGGPAFIVVLTMLGGMSLQHAVIVNVFWIVVGPLMLGPRRKYRAVHTKTVAKAMLACAAEAAPGVHIVESDRIQELGQGLG